MTIEKAIKQFVYQKQPISHHLQAVYQKHRKAIGGEHLSTQDVFVFVNRFELEDNLEQLNSMHKNYIANE